MADKSLYLRDLKTNAWIPVKYHDNGDGTYSLVAYTGGSGVTIGDVNVLATSGVGSLTEAAPATDTASSGLNGRLQRIAQRITSLIALLPAALGAGGGLKVDGSGTALPVSFTDSSGSGAYTTPTHTAPTAGAATGVILAANANRLYALFINDSDTTVYLSQGVAAVVNTGIRLNALGGSYEMSKKLGNLYLGAVNGISEIAGKIVLTTEGV